MESLWISLAAVALASLGVVAVFLIQTLIQLKRTARSAETLIENLNREMERVHNVTNVMSSIAGALSSSVGKSAMTLANIFVKVMGSKMRQKASSETASSAERPGADGEKEG